METEQTPHDPSADSMSGRPLSSAADPRSASRRVDGTSKADLGKRFIAMLIDGAVAFVLGWIPVIGGLLGAAYFLVRDGIEVEFMDRRSLGKRVMQLRPVRLDGQPMDLETSLLRNWMFGFGAVTAALVYIPIIGWLLLPIVGLIAFAIGVYEIYLVFTDPEGRRWGDRMAQTKVIEVDE